MVLFVLLLKRLYFFYQCFLSSDLNLLDWGHNNLIGLALGGGVYIWNPVTGDVQQLFQMEGEDYVTSVSWINSGSILAVGNCNGEIQVQRRCGSV